MLSDEFYFLCIDVGYLLSIPFPCSSEDCALNLWLKKLCQDILSEPNWLSCHCQLAVLAPLLCKSQRLKIWSLPPLGVTQLVQEKQPVLEMQVEISPLACQNHYPEAVGKTDIRSTSISLGNNCTAVCWCKGNLLEVKSGSCPSGSCVIWVTSLKSTSVSVFPHGRPIPI